MKSPSPEDGSESAYAEALSALFDRNYDQIRRTVRGARRRAGAPDTLHTTVLLDDTFAKVLAARPDLSDERRFLGYVATVVKNAIRDHFRRERLNPVDADVAELLGAEEARYGHLTDALDKLSAAHPRQADVVYLRFVGMKYEAIARHLGVSERTVRNDVADARVFLSTHLETSA